jgi:hypothetical protein
MDHNQVFVDFVQRNVKKPLYVLSKADGPYRSFGSIRAILVLVPDRYTKEHILRWKLSDFKKFNYEECEYENGSFDKINGYQDYLAERSKVSRSGENWWDFSVWKEPLTREGMWIVNFEYYTYGIFVLEISKGLPWHYKIIFDNRNVDVPSSEELAFRKVVSAGDENIWEYEKFNNPKTFRKDTSEEISIPEKIHELSKEVQSLDIFIKDHTYLTNVMPFQSCTKDKSRFDTLLADNMPSNKYYKSFIVQPVIDNIYIVRFILIDIIFNDISRGCLKCDKKRWTGLESCLDHQEDVYKDIKKYRKLKQNLVNKSCDKYIARMNVLKDLNIPEELMVSFVEKDVKYEIILKYKKDEYESPSFEDQKNDPESEIRPFEPKIGSERDICKKYATDEKGYIKIRFV